MTKTLNATQASSKMGLSPQKVSRMCRNGELKNAKKVGGQWSIPQESVEEWIANHKTHMVNKWLIQSWLGFKRYFGWFIAVLVTLITVLGIVSVIADFGGAKQQLRKWGVLREFESERIGETLIIVASFHTAEGVINTEPHLEIKSSIQKTIDELGLEDLRVEWEPFVLMAEDRKGAISLGKRYDASIIIWGSDTGARVTVNFLNIKELQDGPERIFYNTDVKLTETDKTQLANPEAYSKFVTSELPQQLKFLSLFSVGQSLFYTGEFQKAADVLDESISSSIEQDPIEGLAAAYFRLGWLYQTALQDQDKAIEFYSKSLGVEPSVNTYGNRGIAYYFSGDYESALADFNSVISLDPEDASSYNGRGLVYQETGKVEEAFFDYNKAIELDSNYAPAFHNRAIWFQDRGELEEALDDFNHAIELYAWSARTYYNRGKLLLELGEFNKAISDFSQAIELFKQDPLPDECACNYYVGRADAKFKLEDYQSAVDDYSIAIRINPDYEDAYLGRGKTQLELGNTNGALTDFKEYLRINPYASDKDQVETWISDIE